MTGTAKFIAFFLMAGSLAAGAQIAGSQSSTGTGASATSDAGNFAARVRENKSWESGTFVNYGVGVGERASYKFLWAGYQLGKPLTPVFHAGVFSGQFEFAGNIMPLWQAYTPAPHLESSICYDQNNQPFTCQLAVGGGTFHGVSMTPVILRWNFLTPSRRIQPWFQAAGGLVYTTHKFPPNYQSTQTINGQTLYLDGGTCVWNFSPQGGVGIHYFTSAKRSIDLGVNGVHISSASLGDRNPGVNASVQFQLGYTFWK